MKIYFFLLIYFLVYFNLSFADNYPRNHDIDIIHYTFKITLSDTTNVIVGKTTVNVKFLRDNVTEFKLDFIGRSGNDSKGMLVSSVLNNAKPCTFKQSFKHLLIELNTPSIKDSVESFTVKYTGIPADGLIISKNKYGDRTFFGDNWPNRARYWLPTIDHPYDKATCDFVVIAPNKYQVIANGILKKEIDLPEDMRLTHWKETTPISTKIMVIGVAKFAVKYLPSLNCIPVESWVYPQDMKAGFYDFSSAENIIKYFVSLIGPFPFHKLANVESKTQYGGMENAGNIFYSEKEITGQGNIESTIAHEIAHQWFGDAVTEADWDHIWLSEGFATFFQNIFVEHEFGADSLYKLLNYNKQLINSYDIQHPEAPVVDTAIVNLNLLLNPNTYQKGAWVLRMLENYLGKKDFWKGIRTYYRTYRNKNVLTKDFEKIMEEISGKNLEWFFNQWIYKPGIPYVSGSWQLDKKNKILKLIFIQKNNNEPIFQLSLSLRINFRNNIYKTENIFLNKKQNEFNFKLEKEPKNIIIDPGHWILMNLNFRKTN